ncbi:MAG: N(5)-(carboxyethyl)ornithine synthase [Anaerococcus hydrogenalis]|nr:N(5)-(carboxyethyl)ornithine synthase [Anaerococcus hydrogenalis]
MLRTIGFPISHKENEFRRVIVPKDIKRMKHPEYLYFEKNYGGVLGIDDKEYEDIGCKILSHEEVLNMDAVCDPKIGDADYLENLKEGQIIFGWIHATQNIDITDKLISKKLSAFAWEKMYEEGRHIFWHNNELAGEAAIMHAFQCYGKMPYGCKVAVIGKGNTARGAIKVLHMLGAQVVQYDRHTEKLLSREIEKYDVIVNCILWDVKRDDHIIYKKDLKRMKKNSMIIDVSCDKNGGIETSIPTTIENPTYKVEGILHYVVDHTPSIFYKTFTLNNSKIIYKFLDEIIENKYDKVMKDALIVENGKILDEEINIYQERNKKL